jgi:hypothetical protein
MNEVKATMIIRDDITLAMNLWANIVNQLFTVIGNDEDICTYHVLAYEPFEFVSLKLTKRDRTNLFLYFIWLNGRQKLRLKTYCEVGR